jgi:hypothetical protein
MTSASMSFGSNVRYREPLISTWLSAAVGGLMRFLHRLDQWELTQERNPTPRTPEEVLFWASRIERSDPGFASDLRAAALRAQNQLDD